MKRDVPVGLSPFLIRVDEPAIAGRTDIAAPLRRFIATAPPRLDPTTTTGWLASKAAWAVASARSKSSWSSVGSMTSWPRERSDVGFTPPTTEFQPGR